MRSLKQEAAKQAPSTDDLVLRARDMIEDLRACAERTERERRVASETMNAFRDAGFFKLLQPRRFGGYQRGFSDLVRINLEIARGCGSTGWCASLAMTHQWFAALFPLEAQEDVWREPDAILAGSYAPSGVCEAVDGGWLVSGKWGYASNCDNVQWCMVGVMLPADASRPQPTHAILLVPRADVFIEDTWFVAGLAGTGSKTIVLDKVFVPAHRTLLRTDMMTGSSPGAEAHGDSLYRIPFYAALPFCLASPAVGMAYGALDAFLAWAKGPKATSADVQTKLASASAAIDAASLVIQTRVADVEKTIAVRPIAAETRVSARRDQAYAVQLAKGAVDELLAAQSAGGLALGSPVQRFWRDITTASHHVSLHWSDVSVLYGQFRLGLEPKGIY